MSRVLATDWLQIATVRQALRARPPPDEPAKGRYRRRMPTRFDEQRYHRRAQVETVTSMIKRCQGAHAGGRTYHSQRRDLRLMALTHNVMILFCVEVFYSV
jgi:hypothetical protein